MQAKAFTGLAFLVLFMAACVFGPAWTFDYWQAWVFLGAYTFPVITITLYLVKNDPKLLERRITAGPLAEKERNQKVIQTLAQIVFISTLLIPSLDHRFGWSTLSPVAVIVGDCLVVTGILIVFFVFRENTFTSGVIEVAAEQRVISTGPYAIVRHPMYAGALIMLAGVPIALGSWWGLLTIVPMTAVIVGRIVNEEKFLANNLSGYVDYQTTVRSRLVPGIW